MKEQIKELEEKLTGNIFNDAGILDKIRELQGVKVAPRNPDVECEGCGS